MRGQISQARQNEGRGKGAPYTDEERWERHQELYPGTPLPERGTGLISQGTLDSLLPTFIIAGTILLSTVISIHYARR